MTGWASSIVSPPRSHGSAGSVGRHRRERIHPRGDAPGSSRATVTTHRESGRPAEGASGKGPLLDSGRLGGRDHPPVVSRAVRRPGRRRARSLRARRRPPPPARRRPNGRAAACIARDSRAGAAASHRRRMAGSSTATSSDKRRLPASVQRRRQRMRRRIREPQARVQIPVWDASPSPVPGDDEMTGVDALLSGLNPEQRKAVTHETGPLLVVAGAGTGKTQVITRRIAWLIATKRARPSEILALTFTDQAADEMQVRVDQLVPYGYTDTAISTFHAFGDRLIREFALEVGLPTDVRVLSRPEVVVFLREHLFDFELDEYRPLGDPTRFLDSLATLFSRAKDEDVSPDGYLAHAERLAAAAAAADPDAEG